MRLGRSIDNPYEYHSWFAWRPVRCRTRQIVWLETVFRFRQMSIGTNYAEEWAYVPPEIVAKEKMKAAQCALTS